MKDYDLFNDLQDEFASPEQRAEMRELGINPDKHRLITPIIWIDTGDKEMWGSENETRL